VEQQAFRSAREQASKAAAQINQAFAEATMLGDALARDLEHERLPYHDIDSRMKSELSARPNLYGIAITFEPYVYSRGLKLYQSYVSRRDDGTLNVLNGATYDYTQPPTEDPAVPKTDWYHGPLRAGATWSDPFLAAGAGKVLIEYGVPFAGGREPGARVAGVVTVDYSLQSMRDLVAALDLGSTGYGFVFSPTGRYLAHPEQHLIAQASMFDAKESLYAPAIQGAARKALGGESLALKYNDAVSGQTAWFFFEPITTTKRGSRNRHERNGVRAAGPHHAPRGHWHRARRRRRAALGSGLGLPYRAGYGRGVVAYGPRFRVALRGRDRVDLVPGDQSAQL
jgi:Methyl-accepting chemotaxis protein-like, first PDC sensor domain